MLGRRRRERHLLAAILARGLQMMMTRKCVATAVVVLLAGSVAAELAGAQARPTVDTGEPQKMLLWEHGAPGAQGSEGSDKPTLTYYPPTHGNPSGTAVIIAPGGGYVRLAANHEGRQVANWLNSMGVAAFVLIYRLGPKYRHPVELADAQRAIRMVRARAKEFDVLPDRVGIMGFSAGGHLASTTETHFDGGNTGAEDPVDRVSSRPDFAILGYAVVSFMAPELRGSSAKALLGENSDPRQLEELSNERHVTPQTPPTFLFSTSEDKSVPSENSLLFYAALHKAGVPAELHIFEKGPHGVGLDLGDPFLGEWPKLLANWLRNRGLLARPAH
jgi:acetyl esterase/lipase